VVVQAEMRLSWWVAAVERGCRAVFERGLQNWDPAVPKDRPYFCLLFGRQNDDFGRWSVRSSSASKTRLIPVEQRDEPLVAGAADPLARRGDPELAERALARDRRRSRGEFQSDRSSTR
jgi:hypothetical protein